MKQIKDKYQSVDKAVKILMPETYEETKHKNEIREFFETFIKTIGYRPDTSNNRQYKIKRSISNKIAKYYSTPETRKNRTVMQSCIIDLMDNPEELLKIRKQKFKESKKKPANKRKNVNHKRLVNEWIKIFKTIGYIPSDTVLQYASKESRDFLNSRRYIYKNKNEFINDNNLHELQKNSDYSTSLKERIEKFQNYLLHRRIMTKFFIKSYVITYYII